MHHMVVRAINRWSPSIWIRLNQPIGHTPQEPPKPMVTFSPSTMTGTFRVPPDIFNIVSMFWGDAFTSM